MRIELVMERLQGRGAFQGGDGAAGIAHLAVELGQLGQRGAVLAAQAAHGLLEGLLALSPVAGLGAQAAQHQV